MEDTAEIQGAPSDFCSVFHIVLLWFWLHNMFSMQTCQLLLLFSFYLESASEKTMVHILIETNGAFITHSFYAYNAVGTYIEINGGKLRTKVYILLCGFSK